MNIAPHTDQTFRASQETRSSSKKSVNLWSKLWPLGLMVAALMQLCAAVMNFQFLVREYKDIASIVNLENWGPPLFAIGLGVGWVTIHVSGTMLQVKRRLLAIVFFVAFIVEIGVIPLIVVIASQDSLAKELSIIALNLISAGGFLRWSAFSPEFRWWGFMQTGQV